MTQMDIASTTMKGSLYSGTMQRAAQKQSKKLRAKEGGSYNSYEILNQIEQIK